MIPDFKPNLGFDDPAVIFEAALGTTGANLATKKGLVEDFGNIMERAIKAASLFPQQEYLAYLLPLGVRQRALFKMDLAEAAYIIEQRSDVGGHFSYRRVAYEMYQQLCQRYPYLAPMIRVTNPYEVNRLLDR